MTIRISTNVIDNFTLLTQSRRRMLRVYSGTDGLHAIYLEKLHRPVNSFKKDSFK